MLVEVAAAEIMTTGRQGQPAMNLSLRLRTVGGDIQPT